MDVGGGGVTREMGTARTVRPLFGRGSGRRLTAQERQFLLHNREQLIERFRQEHEQRLATAVPQKVQSPQRSAEAPNLDAALHRQAKATIGQRWRDDGIDPSAPGWAGLVRCQVEEEYQRLIAARSAVGGAGSPREDPDPPF